MKLKRIFALLLSLACLFSSAAFAQRRDVIDALYKHLSDGKSMQEWIDAEITPAAGSAVDAYIINLSKTGHDLNLEDYIRSAAAVLRDAEMTNPVSRMRCALALISCGGEEYIPDGFADECIGKLGVMSYIYGLILIRNGAASELWSEESIISKLAELQKQDGGWAAVGNFGDVDVTAMCLQALALCDSEAAKAEIDGALAFLSEQQLESAGFISLGNENSESASQVLIALSSLGINPETDERFIKNGKTVIDALMAYQLPSGGFAHLPGAEENTLAGIQALQALTALENTGKAYLDVRNAPAVEKEAASPLLSGWKLYAMIAVAVFLVVGCIFALTRRHGRIKQLVFVVVIAAIAAFSILSINIESAGNYYSDDTAKEGDGTVYLSIRCDTVAGRADNGSTPEDGTILERTAMPIAQGDTVFDVLTDAARRYKIHMEHQGGSEDMAYINGINYLYEYAYGDLSGWVYDVNGERYSVGCGAYELSDGDEVIWQYTLELGEDLK